MESLGHVALLKEAYHWGRALGVYSLRPHPSLILCLLYVDGWDELASCSFFVLFYNLI